MEGMQRAAFREQKNVKSGVRSLASSLSVELRAGGLCQASREEGDVREPQMGGSGLSGQAVVSGFAQSLGSVLVLPLPHCVTLSL